QNLLWPSTGIGRADPAASQPRGIGDRFGEVGVFLAVPAADLLDRLELRLGAGDIALLDVGLTEIFPDLGILRVGCDRLQVVADSLVEVAELARRETAIVERLRRVRVLQQVQDRERFGISSGL